jgi:AraC-like DNA-binding protein
MRELSGGSRSVTDLAFLLGFSETSAFDRAFRRWTGLSPVEFRAGARTPRPG